MTENVELNGDSEASHWVISEAALRDLLCRAHEGEDPEVLLLEQYANSDHEEVPDEWRACPECSAEASTCGCAEPPTSAKGGDS